jgi:glycosidase
MEDWSSKFFYHIYPLGFCGAPRNNDFVCPAGSGLHAIEGHIPRLRSLGVSAVLLGPLFESSSHGYDTVDYFWADRRLGNNDSLAALVRAFHEAGMSVVLDAVFNHTGRDFFAFKDIQRSREASLYADWYAGLDFSGNNSYNDGFSYEGWAGHNALVKLNLSSEAVREHLFAAALSWIRRFDIDGLRLDAANVMSRDFLGDLAALCKAEKPGFWLMGETVAGDYRELACEGRLDSVTNYELYKGLWSSFNDKNFFELAWTLKRQFGEEGLYKGIGLYNFADNHDCNRLASTLKNPAHLFPLYGALFCAPGIPSVYYGSEYGVRGERDRCTDHALRPAWDAVWEGEGEALFDAIRRFAEIRRESKALQFGSYRELYVSGEQFAFMREYEGERLIAAVNAAQDGRNIMIKGVKPAAWRDLLSGEEFYPGQAAVNVPQSWLRILKEGSACP